MPIPARPKLYHIVHMDRLSSIIQDGWLHSYADRLRLGEQGTTIGMADLKTRRLRLGLQSQPGLPVGACVPFYFCSRSVMLYLMYRGNHPNMTYKGGQAPIVHLEADLYRAVEWAESADLRWAFTLSNAASNYFEDRSSLDDLGEVDWTAVEARTWSGRQEAKQAEFLIESRFPWALVERIGVMNRSMLEQVSELRQRSRHRPPVEVRADWYYP